MLEKRLAAKHEVIGMLIDVCEQSPMADDPEVWVESLQAHLFSGEDLAEALLDVKQFLESTKMNLL